MLRLLVSTVIRVGTIFFLSFTKKNTEPLFSCHLVHRPHHTFKCGGVGRVTHFAYGYTEISVSQYLFFPFFFHSSKKKHSKLSAWKGMLNKAACALLTR